MTVHILQYRDNALTAAQIHLEHDLCTRKLSGDEIPERDIDLFCYPSCV